MSAPDTHDEICAANMDAIARLKKSLPSEQIPDEIMMVHDTRTGGWHLHLDQFIEEVGVGDVVSYSVRLPGTVRNSNHLIGYLKGEEWADTLFSMSQDFDAWHGPNPVKLD